MAAGQGAVPACHCPGAGRWEATLLPGIRPGSHTARRGPGGRRDPQDGSPLRSAESRTPVGTGGISPPPEVGERGASDLPDGPRPGHGHGERCSAGSATIRLGLHEVSRPSESGGKDARRDSEAVPEGPAGHRPARSRHDGLGRLLSRPGAERPSGAPAGEGHWAESGRCCGCLCSGQELRRRGRLDFGPGLLQEGHRTGSGESRVPPRPGRALLCERPEQPSHKHVAGERGAAPLPRGNPAEARIRISLLGAVPRGDPRIRAYPPARPEQRCRQGRHHAPPRPPSG